MRWSEQTSKRDRERIIAGRVVALKRGQMAVSLRDLALTANWSVKSVRGFIDRLARHDMATRSVAGEDRDCQGHTKGTPITVLTICNYDAYQRPSERKGKAKAQQGHSKGTRLYQEYQAYQEERDAHSGRKGSGSASRQSRGPGPPSRRASNVGTANPKLGAGRSLGIAGRLAVASSRPRMDSEEFHRKRGGDPGKCREFSFCDAGEAYQSYPRRVVRKVAALGEERAQVRGETAAKPAHSPLDR